MSRGQARSHGQHKSKLATQSKAKEHGQQRSKKPRADLVRVREAIFSLSPVTLNKYLSFLNNDESDVDESGMPEDAVELEDTVDEGTDLEVTDEDEFFESESLELPALNYAIPLGDALFVEDSAVFRPDTVYAILVVPLEDGSSACRFDGPAWFDRRLSPEIGNYVNKLRSFLSALALCFEEDKQQFLKNPTVENFASGESHHPFAPIVLQDGLLSRVNTHLPEAAKLEKTSFSRLLDKIWLVWPEWSLPLKRIFSQQFRCAWLLEVCTDLYRGEGSQWHEKDLHYPDFGADDLRRIKSRVVDKSTKQIEKDSFALLDPEEKLHLLRDKIGIDIRTAQHILGQVIDRLTTEDRGEDESKE